MWGQLHAAQTVRLARSVRESVALEPHKVSERMPTDTTHLERHYSIEELSELWKMSDDFVRRLFLREPGVVIFYNQRPGRRVYRTLRIPESVAMRVYRRMRRA